jgi:uncharacterized ferritin-like protein (DUF455 family)
MRWLELVWIQQSFPEVFDLCQELLVVAIIGDVLHAVGLEVEHVLHQSIVESSHFLHVSFLKLILHEVAIEVNS